MYARAFIRKDELNRHGIEGTVAGIGGVPTVGIRLGGLAKKGHVRGAAKGIIGNPDGFGGGGGDLILGSIPFTRNGDGLGLDRCREGMGELPSSF